MGISTHHQLSTIPRSNGKAESAVKIAKSILTKCKADGSNIWHAILNWRNIPTDGIGTSPSQRLMSRHTCTCLPVATNLVHCRAIPGTGMKQKLVSKRQNAKKHYDHETKQLSQLSAGQSVQPWVFAVKNLGQKKYVWDR